MSTNTNTTNLSYPLPYPSNLLAVDVLRLRDALNAIDADMAARPDAATVTAEINAAIQAMVAGAPGALDTLNELAAALGDDANFSGTVTAQLGQKANASDVYSKTDADNRYRQHAASVISLGTQQATTSGTFKDFTAIPSWARQVTVAFQSVSTNGTADILVQLGAGGTPTTSGYTGQSAFSWSGGTGTTTSADGIPVFNNDPGFLHFGHLTFLNVNGNDWLASGHFATGGSYQGATVSSGVIQLSGVLDNLRVLTANGTDAFDAGSVNIAWQ